MVCRYAFKRVAGQPRLTERGVEDETVRIKAVEKNGNGEEGEEEGIDGVL